MAGEWTVAYCTHNIYGPIADRIRLETYMNTGKPPVVVEAQHWNSATLGEHQSIAADYFGHPALLSGPAGSPEQADGPLGRWVAARAAAGKGLLTTAAVPMLSESVILAHKGKLAVLHLPDHLERRLRA